MRRRWLLGLLLLPLCMGARPPLVVPDDPSTVLERLPEGYAALRPRADQAPSPSPSLDQIQALLLTASRTGDARLVARAEGALARFPKDNTAPALMRARAHVAQYRHDFTTARRWLDRLIALEPRNGGARLARAQMSLVQGRLGDARADCAALTLGIDSGDGLLCTAALALRQGQYDAAAGLLDRWLEMSRAGDAEGRRYALVMRAEAASRAGDGDAGLWFRRALELAPGNVRTLAAYSRHLRGAGRPEQALALLPESPVSEHLQLERVLAAHAAGVPEAPALAEALARRYEQARAVGTTPDLRDEAEFLLTLREDPAAALPLAQQNFQTQRDYEDVDLLRRAAMAADREQALQPLRAWAESQSLRLPPLQPATGGDDA